LLRGSGRPFGALPLGQSTLPVTVPGIVFMVSNYLLQRKFSLGFLPTSKTVLVNGIMRLWRSVHLCEPPFLLVHANVPQRQRNHFSAFASDPSGWDPEAAASCTSDTVPVLHVDAKRPSVQSCSCIILTHGAKRQSPSRSHRVSARPAVLSSAQHQKGLGNIRLQCHSTPDWADESDDTGPAHRRVADGTKPLSAACMDLTWGAVTVWRRHQSLETYPSRLAVLARHIRVHIRVLP
jgi:hypothetical protein